MALSTFAAARAALVPLPGAPAGADLFLPDPNRSIAGLLPAGLDAIGAERPADRRPLAFPDPPPGDRLFVLFVDALGLDLLLDVDGPARRLLEGHGTVATSVLPTITPVAATSLYTGLPPAGHGLEGHKVRLAPGGCVADVLKMEEADERTPLAEADVAAIAAEVSPRCLLGLTDVPAFHLIPGRLLGSGLSRAIFPDSVGRLGYVDLFDGAARAAALLERHPRCVVVLYAPHLDDAAHLFAPHSDECRACLAHIERVVALALRRLDARVRAGTLLLLASDHGQRAYDGRVVRVPLETRPTLAAAGVEAIGTSGRFLHAHLAAGADRATAREALAGVLGEGVPVLDGAGGRAGDLVAPMPAGARLKVERPHHRRAPPEPRLLGEAASHGSLTPEELLVPALLCRGDEYPEVAGL